MNIPPRPAPRHVPTLTEVIEAPSTPALIEEVQAMPAQVPVLEPVSVPFAAPEPVSVAPVTVAAPAPDLSHAAIPRSLLVDPAPPLPASTPSPAAPAVVVDEALIAQRVLVDLQRQIDGMLEYRLRETLAPILARATDALMRDLRQELSKTMKDVVARSVAQEVARQRSRG
jgi:hypothetical protein